MPNLFVYGTLRTPVGGPATDTRYHQRIASELRGSQIATLANAHLFDLGAYPGVAPGTGTVTGELFDLSDHGLAICDRIEGHPDFFVRDQVEVALEDGTTSQAWVYWAPPTMVADREPVAGGDWFTRDRTATVAPPATTIDGKLAAALHRLGEELHCWLAIVDADGRPHSVPMWHIIENQRIYLATASTSNKVIQIDQNPNVVINLPDPEEVVIIDGWAIQRPELIAAIGSSFEAKYRWNPANGWDTGEGSAPTRCTIVEIAPLRAQSWSTK